MCVSFTPSYKSAHNCQVARCVVEQVQSHSRDRFSRTELHGKTSTKLSPDKWQFLVISVMYYVQLQFIAIMNPEEGLSTTASLTVLMHMKEISKILPLPIGRNG